MFLDKERIKQSLTSEDIELILKDLGSNSPLYGNQYQTVCHGGDSHKLYYYEDSKEFRCYTSCSENMDIYELIIKHNKERGIKFTFPKAVRYVADKTGKYFTLNNGHVKTKSYIVDDWNWINKLKRKDKINTEVPIVSEHILDIFIHKPHELWLEEISYDTQMKYNVCYYVKGNRIVTPHRNIDNQLIGLTGRALNEEEIESGRKYMPLTIENKLYSFPTMFNLYGLNHTKEAIKRLKKVAIFESQKSCMQIEDMYKNDNFSVATCSSNISNYQVDMLLRLGVEEVIICFDKFRAKKEDETNNVYKERRETYEENIIKLSHKFTPFVRTYIVYDSCNLLDYKDSPSDKGKEVLELLMKNKLEVKTQEEEIDDI